MIKNGSKPKIWVIETSKFGHLFSFWSPIKTLDFGQFHLDSPAGDSPYSIDEYLVSSLGHQTKTTWTPHTTPHITPTSIEFGKFFKIQKIRKILAAYYYCLNHSLK